MPLNILIQLILIIPIIGFLVSLIIPARNEAFLSRTAVGTSGLCVFSLLILIFYWLWYRHPSVNIAEISLFKDNNYEFLIDLYFDKITMVFLFVGSILVFLITIYSRYYMHREEGYKRFFNTILFFFAGYNLTVISGNLETLFMGWETLGISSFLLISFYRDRYLPARNAVKVFSIYRIGDVGILLAMWASHHLWHENVTFEKLNNYGLVQEQLGPNITAGFFIALMLLIAASAKSAQLPFSSWLPRAMEGPTPSSAIFYGSLSVHIGVFLLLRTLPFWSHLWGIRIIIGMWGLATSLVSVSISRVQSSIKTQIAYASIAQIGLIFIELSLGLEKIALIHFMGNAFLRTYQLLISPSVISSLIREQFYKSTPHINNRKPGFFKRMEYSLYLLNVNEWNLDGATNRLIFTPLKRLGQRLDFLMYRNVFYFVIPAYAFCVILLAKSSYLPEQIKPYFPFIFSFIGLVMVLKSFSERKYPRLAWLLIVFNHLWIVLAISFNEQYNYIHAVIYLSGIVISGIIGFVCLLKLKKLEPVYSDLNQYYGHVYEYPKLSLFFLFCCLGLMGFPITMTFVGEDLLYSHMRENQFFLAFFNALSFIMGGISLIRIYTRLFLGPHIKTYHETALKAS